MLTAADLAAIRAIVREELRGPSPLDPALLLRAIAAAFGSAEFTVHDLLRHPDVAALLCPRSPRAVGKALAALRDRPCGGIVLRLYVDERTRAGRLWCVLRL